MASRTKLSPTLILKERESNETTPNQPNPLLVWLYNQFFANTVNEPKFMSQKLRHGKSNETILNLSTRNYGRKCRKEDFLHKFQSKIQCFQIEFTVKLRIDSGLILIRMIHLCIKYTSAAKVHSIPSRLDIFRQSLKTFYVFAKQTFT